MKLTKGNIAKRLSNWHTWVALFALAGMIGKSLGYGDFEGALGQIQEIVYTFGVILGVWSSHEGGEE